MSAEDTELTFIRCPSCRSLVPAVATRCRMCGHQFSSQESSEPAKSKTKQASEETQRNVLYSEPVEETSYEPEYDEMAEDDNEEEDDVEDEFSPSQGVASIPEGGQRKKRRRRRKKKSQDFPAQERSEQPRVEQPARPEFAVRAEAPKVETPRVESVHVERPRIETPSPRAEYIPSAEPRSTVVESPRYSEPARAAQPARSIENGVLVGWLVNYAQNSNGAAIELRSGKYFVARQRLRDDDLVIPDSAISTPHCLVKVSKGQLQIQDLMSEQGTFVKKANSSSFVPVEEAGFVEHGDKIRFGAFELVVCLIP